VQKQGIDQSVITNKMNDYFAAAIQVRDDLSSCTPSDLIVLIERLACHDKKLQGEEDQIKCNGKPKINNSLLAFFFFFPQRNRRP
jgi:hypothetical protein